MPTDLLDIDLSALNSLSRQELLELVDTTDRWATPEDTKFHLYKPTTIATYIHSSPAKIRANFGGNRSSKTYAHIVDYACQFTGTCPPSLEGLIPKHRLDPTRRLRLCMNDYPNNFMKVIWPYIKQLVPPDYITDVIKDSGRIKAIVNSKGGFIEFMQYDQDTEKFQGASLHSIGYDEEPPMDKWKENMMRLADTDGEQTFSLTPVSGALKWLKQEIFDRRSYEVEKMYDFILDDDGRIIDVTEGDVREVQIPGGDPDIHCFFSCIFDNPGVTKDAAIRILRKFPKEETVVRGKGHFLFIGGLVYPMYSDTTHVVEPFEWWDGEYTLYIFIDPHPRTPHAVSFFVVRRDGIMVQVDELFTQGTAFDLANLILPKCRGIMPEVIVCDPLAWNNDIGKVNECFAFNLMDALAAVGITSPFIKASKDLTNGILNTKRALTPEPDSYGNKSPHFYVTSNCTNFRREITNWSWDDWASGVRDTKGEKQVPVDKDDHFMENLYRFINFNPRWKPVGKIKPTHHEPEEPAHYPRVWRAKRRVAKVGLGRAGY